MWHINVKPEKVLQQMKFSVACVINLNVNSKKNHFDFVEFSMKRKLKSQWDFNISPKSICPTRLPSRNPTY
jgi:hypothetical protein